MLSGVWMCLNVCVSVCVFMVSWDFGYREEVTPKFGVDMEGEYYT